MAMPWIDYWAHGTATSARPHEWRYLGRVAQAYHCGLCDTRVTKADLKANTDA